MNQNKFKELYKRLNAEQKKAVDFIEGPVMIIAGPGTGKTRTLTLRIANILRKTDIEPENILALTFTESAAFSMRSSLSEIIGSPAYSVSIKTFHSFCNDIIKNYPEYFPSILSSTNITEIDQIKIIENIIKDINLKELKPFGNNLYYVRPIISCINNLKREGVTVKEYKKILKKEKENFNKNENKEIKKGEYLKKEKRIKKEIELSLVYKKYQEKLQEIKSYDYNDMIVEVLKALKKNKDLLLFIQEQYQYFLIDEHQDTNNSQNKILKLLCNFHKNPNIFIVGDEKQAIFRFQGASIENFYYFKKIYKDSKIIFFKENYRSSQIILDAAFSLIRSKEKLNSNKRVVNEKINVYNLPSIEEEAFFISKDIKEKIKKGIDPKEIAVFYRDNKEIFKIIPFFKKMGIPYSIESDQDILEDNDIKKIIVILKAINNFGSQREFIEALHIDFLKIDPLDIYKIIEYSSSKKISVFNVIKSKKITNYLKLESSPKIIDFYRKMSKLSKDSKNKSLTDFFEKTIRTSGFLSYLLNSPNFDQKINKLNGFFREIKKLMENYRDYKLEDLVSYIDMIKKHKVIIKKEQSFYFNAVKLMTAHKSKGLEFDFVYIFGLVKGRWGDKKKINSLKLSSNVFSLSGREIIEENEEEDERRLFYVALTRARKGITVSFPKYESSGRENLPSKFLLEIDSKFLIEKNSKKFEKEFNKSNFFLKSPVVLREKLKKKEFIRNVFKKKGLSVSGLNNYLSCPIKYFYSDLLKIPASLNKNQMYGSAIHNSLSDFFNAYNKRKISKKFLLEKFNYRLKEQPLNSLEFKEVYERGIKSLSGYYDFYSKRWSFNALTEYNINGIVLSPDIRLVGRIDKIERIGTGNKVNIVDYKTGKIKSRKEIEGKTKNSDGNIYRQLVFYNLLLEKAKKFKMISGEIDFIDPINRCYKKEKFEIKKEEIKELENLILKTSKEILSLSFLNNGCNDKNCEFCNLMNKGK